MDRESLAIAAVETPATKSSLVSDLVDFGLSAGDVVLVHSSMSKIGWTVGGQRSVCDALLKAVMPGGTIVMPSQSGEVSDPAEWQAPPVPVDWFEIIRQEMPAFDTARTPTRSMGQIVECLRAYPETMRSQHPQCSFIANGPMAQSLLADHVLEDAFGEQSPLARLYDLDAKILFLGTSHGTNTALHLAENRATWPSKSTTQASAPIQVEGERVWATWTQLDIDEGDFTDIGEAIAAADLQRTGRVGACEATLMSLREVVDFAVGWMQLHR